MALLGQKLPLWVRSGADHQSEQFNHSLNPQRFLPLDRSVWLVSLLGWLDCGYPSRLGLRDGFLFRIKVLPARSSTTPSSLRLEQ